MKKILRLVTTSVLTLTLVACGEASTSSSTNSTSSSVTTTSGFTDVTSVTLSAASDGLTQVVGSLKTVVVTAALNAGTNPTTPVVWTVNGVESKQTGRVFEFTPTTVGTFNIQAKVGTTVSNLVPVSVTSTSVSSLVVITDVEFDDTDTLFIDATPGSTISISGKTILPSSFYDLTEKVYVVNVKEAFKDGDSAVLTVVREGLTQATRTITYDTRKIEVNNATFNGDSDEIELATDGAYEVVRPHILSSTGGLNAASYPVVLDLKSTSLNTTALVNYRLERLSAPTGAAAFVADIGQTTISSGNAGDKEIRFNVTRTTPVGDYVFKLTLGAVSQEFTVRVLDTTPTLELVDDVITLQLGTKVENTVSNAATEIEEVDGVFEITKDYLPTQFKQFSFSFNAENINVPTNLLGTATAPINTNPNQILVSVVAPDGIPSMRVTTASPFSQSPLPNPQSFRNVLSDFTVTQKLDASTAVGDYVYTVRVLQLGTEIHRETLTVRVKAPTPSMTVVGTVTDPDGRVWEEALSGVLDVIDFDPELKYVGIASGTAPEDDEEYTYWLDLTPTSPATAYVLKEYDDDAVDWVAVTGYTPVDDDLFIDTENLKIYEFDDAEDEQFVDITNEFVYSGLDAGFEFILTDDTDLEVLDNQILKFNAFDLSLELVENEPYFINSFNGEIFESPSGDFVTTNKYFSGFIPRVSLIGTIVEYTNDTNPANDDAGTPDQVRLAEFTDGIYTLQTYVDDAWTNTSAADGTLFAVADGLEFDLFVLDSSLTEKWTSFAGKYHAILVQDDDDLDLLTLTGTSGGAYDVTTVDYETIASLFTGESINTGFSTLSTFKQTQTNLRLLENPYSMTTYATEEYLSSANFGGKFMVYKSKPVTTTLSEVNGAYVVEKPLRSGLDGLTVNFTATLSNYQSPISLTAAPDLSFAGQNTNGIEGSTPRLLIDFVKTYSGPATLAAALGNVTDELIAVTTNSDRNGFATQTNRITGSSSDDFTKFMGTGSTVNLGKLFELPVSFNSTNGNYTFGLQVGEFTETIVVTVVSPTAELEIDVLDLTNDEALTATNGVYQVTLNELEGDVTIAFDVTVLNARPSEIDTTYDDTGYVLTRDFNGDWNDVRTNVATSTNLPGNDGHLYFSPTVSGGLVQIMQGVQPNTHATSLVLDEPGEYSFKLVVGNAVKEFTIEVLPLPTLELVDIYVNDVENEDEQVALSDPQPIVFGTHVVPFDVTTLFIDVEAENIPSTTYFKVVAGEGTLSGAGSAPVGASDSAAEKKEATLAFEDDIARVEFEVPESAEFGVNYATVYLYNSAFEAIGYFVFSYALVYDHNETEYSTFINASSFNLWAENWNRINDGEYFTDFVGGDVELAAYLYDTGAMGYISAIGNYEESGIGVFEDLVDITDTVNSGPEELRDAIILTATDANDSPIAPTLFNPLSIYLSVSGEVNVYTSSFINEMLEDVINESIGDNQDFVIDNVYFDYSLDAGFSVLAIAEGTLAQKLTEASVYQVSTIVLELTLTDSNNNTRVLFVSITETLAGELDLEE
jgi:hypothetical protein